MSSPKPSCITWGGLEMLFARIDLDSSAYSLGCILGGAKEAFGLYASIPL